jgi:hypothetical protein
MTDKQQVANVERERAFLEKKLKKLIEQIGNIPIASKRLMPLGWRKAAKGRTVWRIIEEVISQNLELQGKQLGFSNVEPAKTEVDVYDFMFSYGDGKRSYVNIKSSVKGGKKTKDDISKANGLINFYNENPDANLYVATFVICFNEDLTVGIEKCIVFPTAWIPDVYVNPSNNGNLQSSCYKDLDTAKKRTPQKFFKCLVEANNVALAKKKRKSKRK